ncbi:MAG: O-antigen ligase family protein [Bacteroidetes bacterium]|nr:O-antigen ligase family protein [Bacteroidota bacterium]
MVPLVIALWFVYQLTQYKYINWKGFFSNFWMLVPLAYFLLHAAAYLFSCDKHEALFSIEVKLSFLFLPFLFYNSKFERKDFITLASVFVASNLIAVVICNIHSLANYFSQGNVLTYNSYSLFLHPSYFAMYLVFSLIVLLLADIQITKSKSTSFILLTIAALLIVSGIIFSASKMGLLSLGLIIPAIMFYKLLNANKIIFSFVLFIALLGSGIALFNTTFSPIQRLKNAFSFYNSNQAIDKTTTESNAVRILVWHEAIELIKRNHLLGTPQEMQTEFYTQLMKKQV